MSLRIVGYLGQRDIPINVLCFQVFSNGTEQLLSRTWLLDPIRPVNLPGGNEPWNGEFYCSFGHGPSRSDRRDPRITHEVPRARPATGNRLEDRVKVLILHRHPLTLRSENA